MTNIEPLAVPPHVVHPDTSWVRAEPFAAHLRRLVAATRLPWRVVAMAAQIPSRLARALLRGRARRLPIGMARRIVALTPESLAELGKRSVRATAAAASLMRLRAAGLRWESLAEFAALSVFETRRLAQGDGSTTALVTLRLAAAAEAHGLYYYESAVAAA